MPVADLVLVELPAEEHGLAVAERRKVDQALVEVLHLRAVLVDLVDRPRDLLRLAVDLRSRLSERRGRDAAAVAANARLELLLPGKRLDVGAPVCDEIFDEWTHLFERRIRFFRGEVPHACDSMRRMRARLICWTGLVVVIAGLNYASRFSGGGTSSNARNAVYSYSTFAGGIIVYAFWLGIVLAIANERWDLLALRRPRSWEHAAGWALAVVVAIYVFEGIVSLIPLPQSPGKEQGLTPTHWEPAHAGAFAANVVLFALVAPLVEELTFRGLGQSLLGFLGRWPAIVVTGVAFGATHGLLEALLILVPFGVALAWLRDRTESVYPGMVVHGLFNGVALAAAVLT